MRVWVFGSALLLVWFVLAFLLHKSGFVHILLLTAISMFVIQIAAHRKTKYHEKSSK